MDTCQKCNSERLVEISAHTSDSFILKYSGKTYEGYIPEGLGLGDGPDDVEMTYCANCGQIQGAFPIIDELMLEMFEEE